MAEEAARRAVAAVPLLRTAAGPRDRERWAERLKEEYRALIQVRRSRRPFVSRKFPSFHHLFRLSPFFFPLHFSLFPPYRRFSHSFSSPFPILALFPPFFFPFCFPLAHFSCFSLLLFPIFPSFAPISPFSFPFAFPPLFPLLTFPPRRLLQYVEHNKASDNDWFRLESNAEGTRCVGGRGLARWAWPVMIGAGPRGG